MMVSKKTDSSEGVLVLQCLACYLVFVPVGTFDGCPSCGSSRVHVLNSNDEIKEGSSITKKKRLLKE